MCLCIYTVRVYRTHKVILKYNEKYAFLLPNCFHLNTLHFNLGCKSILSDSNMMAGCTHLFTFEYENPQGTSIKLS